MGNNSKKRQRNLVDDIIRTLDTTGTHEYGMYVLSSASIHLTDADAVRGAFSMCNMTGADTTLPLTPALSLARPFENRFPAEMERPTPGGHPAASVLIRVLAVLA